MRRARSSARLAISVFAHRVRKYVGAYAAVMGGLDAPRALVLGALKAGKGVVTANKMLTADPMMIAFMPCRIAIIEDATGKRWVISMMMDLKMIKSMPADTRKDAEKVMAAMKDMMAAASKGDL